MAEANDVQMQQYADERIRVRAEQLRTLYNALRDDKAAIEDIYQRSVGASPWNDSRTDGPPNLLTQQDMLTYNAVITNLIKCIEGTATQGEVSDIAANWNVFMAACVRPID